MPAAKKTSSKKVVKKPVKKVVKKPVKKPVKKVSRKPVKKSTVKKTATHPSDVKVAPVKDSTGTVSMHPVDGEYQEEEASPPQVSPVVDKGMVLITPVEFK